MGCVCVCGCGCYVVVGVWWLWMGSGLMGGCSDYGSVWRGDCGKLRVV